jgi:hypothetical protein
MSEVNNRDLQVAPPTPEQVEQAMIQKELKAQSAATDPLDTHAQMFYFFNPRFQSTLTFLSKKQLILLMLTLAGSEHNKREDVSKIEKLASKFKLKSLARVVRSSIDHPLEEITLQGKLEEKLFQLFDSLLANKYYTCIQKGMEKKEADPESVKQIEDVILHTHNIEAFNKRIHAEKDAFAIGNKLLASKFLMMLTTHLREMERQKVAEELNKVDKEEIKE